MKRVLEGIILTVLVCMLILGLYARFIRRPKRNNVDNPSNTATPVTVTSTPESTATIEPTIDPSVFTDTDSYLILANKKHKLPDGYEPSDLVQPQVNGSGAYMRETAAHALEEMFSAARNDGVILRLISGYRSESEQNYLFYTV